MGHLGDEPIDPKDFHNDDDTGNLAAVSVVTPWHADLDLQHPQHEAL